GVRPEFNKRSRKPGRRCSVFRQRRPRGMRIHGGLTHYPGKRRTHSPPLTTIPAQRRMECHAMFPLDLRFPASGRFASVHQINFVLQRTPGIAPERADEAKKTILEQLIEQEMLVCPTYLARSLRRFQRSRRPL